MSKIETQIAEMAEKLAKSTKDSKQLLFETILELGPEGLKKAAETLNEKDQELLKACIVDMAKSKEDLTPKKDETSANAMKQESLSGSDDEDENKLMDDKNAEHNNQGGPSKKDRPEGWEGEVIKAADMGKKGEGSRGGKIIGHTKSGKPIYEDGKSDIPKIGHAAKPFPSKDGMKTIERHQHARAAEDHDFSAHHAIEAGDHETAAKHMAMARAHTEHADTRGTDETRAEQHTHAENGGAEHVKRQAKMLVAERKHGRNSPEHHAAELDFHDHVGSLGDGPASRMSRDRAKYMREDAAVNNKENPMKKALEEIVEMAKSMNMSKEDVVKEIKDGDQDLDKVKQSMQSRMEKLKARKTDAPKEAPVKEDEVPAPAKIEKSIKWNHKSSIAANTLGRNTHWDVDAYIVKSEEDKKETMKKGAYFSEDVAETLVKSEGEKLDINDLIAKGMDYSTEEIKRLHGIRDHKIEGRVVKSFLDIDIAKALGMTEEEYTKLMGE
jgi:hypothetical protein